MTWRLEPPEPVVCCSLAEDDPDHDVEQCLADGAEAAAEARAERQREDAMDEEHGRFEPWTL